jgi:hypothetical protein
MQAIQTKYLAPTDTKGTRIKAICAGGSITVPYRYESDDQASHREAAWVLVAKMNWERSDFVLESGILPNGDLCHLYFPSRVPTR